MIDAELEGEHAGTGVGVPEEERIANAAASDFCVPRDKMEFVHSPQKPILLLKGRSRLREDQRRASRSAGRPDTASRRGGYDYLKKHQAKIRPLRAARQRSWTAGDQTVPVDLDVSRAMTDRPTHAEAYQHAVARLRAPSTTTLPASAREVVEWAVRERASYGTARGRPARRARRASMARALREEYATDDPEGLSLPRQPRRCASPRTARSTRSGASSASHTA